MLKFLGIGLLLSGTAGIGFGKARELDQRVEELRMLLQLVMLLEGEIRCTHRPLPELLISLGERFGPPFQSFLVETGKELEAHKSLTVQEVWKEQLTLGRKKFHLNRQEHEELLEFGGMLGYLDIQMQTELCLWYEERLKISVQAAMSEAGEKRRLYRCLGILSGVVLAVFII